MYDIRWNDEVIDTAVDKEEAEYLRAEYQMVYGPEHRVTIRRQITRLHS